MISSKRLTAFFVVAEKSGLYLIHLENLLMATYTYRKPPGAGLKGPIISSPQYAKGQEARMVYSSCAGTCICLAKNWHPSQHRTRSSASEMAMASKNQLGKLCRLGFSRQRGCRRNKSQFREVASLLLGCCIFAVSLP